MKNTREHEPMTAARPAAAAAAPRAAGQADPVLAHRYVHPVVRELDRRRADGAAAGPGAVPAPA